MLSKWLLGQLHLLGKQHLLIVGLIIVGFVVLTTVLAPFIAPYDPVNYQNGGRLTPPSLKHPMGTDQLGRDVLSRIIYGGNIPLKVAGIAALIALVTGMIIGLLSGYRAGILDRALSLVMDAMYSFPGLILAIAILATMGAGIFGMIFAISFVYIPTYFRVVRGQVLQLREQEFVEAARAEGASGFRILLRHIAPNTINSVMAVLSFNIADAILTEAGLSFLGFGLPPPAPDWGFDISNGQRFLLAGDWWLITFPGIAIILLCLGFGMIGEGISDMINPRRR
ncbi:MAG TPA: ABC transporter permease [Candidatus Fraserbacteria bacterium]|nr:ABC transporter permease [Candidatus Fraserbacteria bacterium]